MSAIRLHDLHFFLGGRDLEMLEIGRLLEAESAIVTDRQLSWGAAVSDYHSEIQAALGAGQTPVLVELMDDLSPECFDRSRTIVVDHHGALAGAERLPLSSRCSICWRFRGRAGADVSLWCRPMTAITWREWNRSEQARKR